MIRLVDKIPECVSFDPELIRIHCNFELYSDIALFWVQDDDKCLISMLDGNMVIFNRNADTEELKEFISVIAPASIFTDAHTLEALRLDASQQAVCVMVRNGDIAPEALGEELSSREIYELLDVDGISLPEYEYFAVDYCRRINHGKASAFALKGICAAISVHTGKYALINGIASNIKGYGSVPLKGIISKNFGRSITACCKENIKGFYLKNGFEHRKNCVYWVKK